MVMAMKRTAAPVSRSRGLSFCASSMKYRMIWGQDKLQAQSGEQENP